MLKNIIVLFVINLFLAFIIYYGIYFYNQYLNSFIGILLGGYALHCYLNNLFLSKYKALLSIVILGLIFGLTGFIIRDLIGFFEISILIDFIIITLLYGYFTKKNQIKSSLVKRMAIFFLSFPVILLGIINILYITPIGYSLFYYQRDLIYSNCLFFFKYANLGN